MAERALIRPLLSEDGGFTAANIARIRTDTALLRAVYGEWRSQVASLSSLGLSVSHLDSHHNLHSRFALLPALRRLVTETGIRRVRNIYDIVSPQHPLRWRGRMKRRAWSLALSTYVRARSPSHLCHLMEFYEHIEGKTPLMASLARRDAVIEVMVHFGNEQYAEEVRILSSGWLGRNRCRSDELSWHMTIFSHGRNGTRREQRLVSSMTRALVTGGAGFIGSHLVDALSGMGCEVHVIDNFMNGRREHIAGLPDDQVHSEDLRDLGLAMKTVGQVTPDIVYHLAAIHFIPYCNDHPTEAVLINILGTRNLLRALAGAKSQRVFFASTAAVYPTKTGAHLEGDAGAPSDIYGATKLAGEALMEAFRSETGAACVVGRLFNAVGPRETNPHLVPEIVRQLACGARSIRLGNLDPRRDFIDARDMALGIVAATGHIRVGNDTFNIGSGSPIQRH